MIARNDVGRFTNTKIFHAGTSVNSEGVVEATGGRVLNYVSLNDKVKRAFSVCYWQMDRLNFEGMDCRDDFLDYDYEEEKEEEEEYKVKVSSKYADAGVDIDAGHRAVQLIRESVESTFTPEVIPMDGGFGGLFSVGGFVKDLQDPVLVASTDGAGTKVKFASLLAEEFCVGRDLVHHCINDILVLGARPLFFLDYFASGKLLPDQLAKVVEGTPLCFATKADKLRRYLPGLPGSPVRSFGRGNRRDARSVSEAAL